jgi:hypothetical protein
LKFDFEFPNSFFSFECQKSFLEIFDGKDASFKSFGKICSIDSSPKTFSTIDNHAMIRLSIDQSNSKRGFVLSYSSNCNRTIERDFGVLESPGFPQKYPHGLDCSWKIVVSKGNKINLQFSQFDIEKRNETSNEGNVSGF